MTKKKSTLKNVNVINHPIIEHKLSVARDKNTGPGEFRALISDISKLMAYEIGRDLNSMNKKISTPLETTSVKFIKDKTILVSVLRAGSGMVDGFMQMIPNAKVGHIGIYRDKFLNHTIEYYFRLPKTEKNSKVIVLDPLLATGLTASAAISRIKQQGHENVEMACVLVAPNGVQRINEDHPDVKIHCISIEKKTDKDGFIRPGIGDAGDRLYDT